MKKPKRKNTMSVRLFLNLTAALLCFLFLVIEGIISFGVYKNIVDLKVGEIYQNQLQQVTDRISFELRLIENLINGIVQNSEQNRFCCRYQEEKNMYTKNQLQKEIKNDLNERTIGLKVSGFEIFLEDNSTMMQNKQIMLANFAPEYKSLHSKLSQSERNVVLIPTLDDESPWIDRNNHIMFAAALTEGGEEAGILVLQMDSTWIDSMLGVGSNAMLFERENQVILGGFMYENTFQAKPIFEKIDGENGSFTAHTEQGDWKIQYQNIEGSSLTAVIPKSISELFSAIKNVLKLVIVFTLLSSVAGFALGELLVGKTVRPIHTLLHEVKSLGAESAGPGKEEQRNINSSMRNTVFLYYNVVILIPMLVYIMTFYFGASNNIEHIVKDSLTQVVEKIVHDIAVYMEVNESASIKIVMDSTVQHFLTEHEEKMSEITLSDIVKLDKVVKKSMTFAGTTTNVEIFDSKGIRVYAGNDYETGSKISANYKDMAVKSRGDAVWNYTDIDRYGKRMICLIRRIYDLCMELPPFRTIGYIKLTIPETEIKNLYYNIKYDNSDFFVLDKKGLYVSGRNTARIGEPSGYMGYIGDGIFAGSRNRKVVRNNKLYDIITAEDSRMPLAFVGEISRDDIIKNNNLIISSSLYLILTICIVIFILSYSISQFFANAFNNMTHKLIRFFKGDLQVDFSSHFYFSEIGQLADTFNHMSGRINDLTETLYNVHLKAKELEKEKKESELIALQAQINPHFLYNTIESIKWMMKYNNESAETMLTKLGELFRLGISSKVQLVTVAEEIRYANTYIDIQRLRYKDQVKIIWEIDENVYENTMPKFTLQPIIENVFKHAFRFKKENCIIHICGYLEENSVVFSIMDNGDGIPQDRLYEINELLQSDLPGESMGIYNVQKRIRIYYGDQGGINFISQEGVSTIVKVCIPVEKNNDNNIQNMQNSTQLQ
ncbi:MAG TPA: histidine kinase [Clostridiales bacterium]|nr:histidine kinase [Clostridiales bacterium]